MHKFIVLALCAVLLSACAEARGKAGAAAPKEAAGARPDWVDGDASRYPRGRFLTGVGQADDLAAAKDRARGEISKVFSTQITMNTAVLSSEDTYGEQGKTSSYSSQRVSQNVRAVTQKDLEGVEIAQTWQDGTGQYYALAVLERSKAQAALEEKIGEVDVLARDTATELEAAAEKLQKAKHALKLLSVLKAREALAGDMRVLNPANTAAPGLDVNAARRSAIKSLGELNVALVMTGSKSPAVAAAVIKALNGLGIPSKTAAAGDGADIAAECSVKLSAVADADPGSRWKWVRGVAAVELKDVATAKIFLNFDASAKEASATEEEARLKTENALGKRISAEISRGVSAYLESQ